MKRKFRIPYGKNQSQEVVVEGKNYLGTLESNTRISAKTDFNNSLEEVLRQPIASLPLSQIAKPGEKVTIVVSDITRPCPSHKLLPPVLKELEMAGIDTPNISIVFAIGNHRHHTEIEMQYLVGKKIYARYRCFDSNANDAVYLGRTTRGTPVEIFRPVVEADRRILLGNVEYHYFAGYSGGLKAIMPGCSTPRAIQANHRMMLEPGAQAGEIENNPVRQDIDEVLRFLTIDFIVNVVLDEHKHILAAFAGHPVFAHHQAAMYLDRLYKIKIPEPADIVIASAGGFPKDINLYQAQKAMDNARRVVKKGGVLILVAECPEGLGDDTFSAWVAKAQEPEDLIKRIQTNFELGGHKAAAIAMALRDIRIYLVSSLPEKVTRQIFLEPFKTLQNAYDRALTEIGPDAKVLLMPQATKTLPCVVQQ